MADRPPPLKLVRGSDAAIAAYRGEQAEPSFNTDTKRIHIHDGATLGGLALALLSDLDALRRTVATGLAAAGTTSGTAFQLTADVTEVTTVDTGAGVKLQAKPGAQITVVNGSANALKVYPPAGGLIVGLVGDEAYRIQPGYMATFLCITAQKFYVV